MDNADRRAFSDQQDRPRRRKQPKLNIICSSKQGLKSGIVVSLDCREPERRKSRSLSATGFPISTLIFS
jgi:hypothetical protein